MNSQIPNLEEAANVAAEFIYSLDNLPHEVSHLLQEIRHLETRSQELQTEIDKDSAKYIRHSRRASSASNTPPSPSSRDPSPKSVAIPAKISASFAEIQDLASEKSALAERLVEIITRTRSKLDVDIARVMTLQGDSPEHIAAMLGKPLSNPTFSADSATVPNLNRLNPAFAIGESLRNALSAPVGDVKTPNATSTSISTGHANKKRRVTQTTSIKVSPVASPTKNRSASPIAAVPATHTQQKSRLSRQVHPPTEDEDNEMDAEGDEEADGDEVEDETLYCFCRKQSYGDMIACDNDDGCPYEWFHLACVGLKQPTPEKWYCDACIRANGIEIPEPPPPPPPTATRKGRRK